VREQAAYFVHGEAGPDRPSLRIATSRMQLLYRAYDRARNAADDWQNANPVAERPDRHGAQPVPAGKPPADLPPGGYVRICCVTDGRAQAAMAQTRGGRERPHESGTTATLGTVQKHCTAGPRHRVVQLAVQVRQNLYASGEWSLRCARVRSNPWGTGWREL
jgi:hypothetical protein